MLLQPLLGGDPGIRLAGELLCPEFSERRLCLFSVLLQPFCECLLLLLLHRCRVVDDPFLGDAGIFRHMLRIPVAVVRARVQGQVCGDEILDLVQGRRHPADPEGMGAEGCEVLGGVERGIGDVVDLPRVLQVFGQLRDDRQQRLLIGFVPGEGLQEERDAVLIGRHPEDELLEIPPAVFGMAVGDGHVAGVEVGVVRAADAERGSIDMEAVRAVIAGEEALGNDLVEEFGRAVRGDRVERPAQDVVVEVVDRHTVAQEPVDGDVREKRRIQVEPPLDKTKTVEHHGFDNIPVGEVVVPCFGNGTVNDLGDPEGVESTGDDPEMADRDVGSFDEISRGGHSRGFSGKYKDLAV